MVVVIWHCTRHRLEAFSQFRARSKAISGVACFADPMGDGSLKPDWSAMVLTPSPKARQVPTVIRVSNSPACTLKPDWSAMVLTPSPNARQMSAKARVPNSPEGSFKADRLAMVSTPSPKARQISATELGPSTCHLRMMPSHVQRRRSARRQGRMRGQWRRAARSGELASQSRSSCRAGPDHRPLSSKA